jgi:hypothetical protein
MHIVGIQASHKDPSYVFSYFRKGSFYENIEDYFDKIILSNDPKEKLKYSKLLSTYLSESAILVPLWDLYSVYFYDSNKIDSSTFIAQPRGMRLKVWEIKLNKE